MDKALTTIQRTCMAELKVNGRWVTCQRPLDHEGWHGWSGVGLGVSWDPRG